MKFFALVFLALAGATNFVWAQTNPSPTSRPPSEVAFLTDSQQKEYAEAHSKALDANPALKAEGESLMQQIMADHSLVGQPDFQAKLSAHRKKLRAAMLKQDSKLGPIFAEIDKHLPPSK